MSGHLRRSTPIIFGLLILFTALIAGEYFGLYSRIANIDKVFHFLGGVAVGWMAVVLFQEDIRPFAGWKRLLVIIALTCLVGVLWEFAEYLSNFSRHSYPLLYHYFHGGGLPDTLADLVADISGGGLAAVVLARQNRD